MAKVVEDPDLDLGLDRDSGSDSDSDSDSGSDEATFPGVRMLKTGAEMAGRRFVSLTGSGRVAAAETKGWWWWWCWSSSFVVGFEGRNDSYRLDVVLHNSYKVVCHHTSLYTYDRQLTNVPNQSIPSPFLFFCLIVS